MAGCNNLTIPQNHTVGSERASVLHLSQLPVVSQRGAGGTHVRAKERKRKREIGDMHACYVADVPP